MSKNNKNNYIDNIPAKNESLPWNEEDGNIIIHRQNKGIYNRIAQKLFGSPKVSHLTLDELGSFIWKQIDGKHSIYQIGQMVKDEFGENAEPLYERLSKYFYSLNSNKFITFKAKG